VSKKIYLFYILTLILIVLSSLFFLYKRTQKSENLSPQPIKYTKTPSSNIVYSISIMSDPHLSLDNLKKALAMSKELNVSYIIVVGDLSDFGTAANLRELKKVLDTSALPYLVLPGDRDVYLNGLESNINNSYFVNVFADNNICSNQLLNQYEILCLSNPYNYILLPDDYLTNFYENLKRASVLVSSQPIYNSQSNIYMGYYDSGVKHQGGEILSALNASSVQLSISGDAHFFSNYSDPYNTHISYFTLGALTDERNIQQPNFAVLKKYENGSFSLDPVFLGD